MSYRALMLLLCLSPLPLNAATTVVEYTLANGLKILVKPDHRAPILTSQLWYHIGSSYEHEGITGISHALEHMMFQGTTRFAPNEFSHIIAQHGGEENAFTGNDYTAYYENLANDRLEIAFELEAERMRQLTLGQTEFAKEMEVIKEERRMRTDDDPQALVYERFAAVAYDVSPYRHPVIGWANDLEQLQAHELREWYRQWYAPNNATLVVAGDIAPEQVLALATTHFGPLKAEVLTPPKLPLEPEQRGEKRLLVKAPAKEPYVLMGYKTPVLRTAAAAWEPYALEMLASVLDGGSSARFARELVRGQQLAASVGASYDAFERLPGMLLFDAVPANGHSVAEVEQAVRAQIARLHTELVSDAELARVRTQVIAAEIYKQDALFAQALQLGRLVAVGLDWRLGEQYVAQLAAVTPAQIQAVAQKYLIPDRLTVAVLEPQPLAAAPSADNPPL
ncbi:peptidase M16 [Chromatium okenii]|uniref:M16 family metallopeptidase n=1 Tax=Chromatium okenii TaxID=61644 RepID=UPI001908199C|nr:pitrilysin family protein [Chromatium okenii]MBK1642673.1 peptidase M16 [Chromatium okenii]